MNSGSGCWPFSTSPSKGSRRSWSNSRRSPDWSGGSKSWKPNSDANRRLGWTKSIRCRAKNSVKPASPRSLGSRSPIVGAGGRPRTSWIRPHGTSTPIPADCTLHRSRPVWRLQDHEAELVAYHIYRGPGGEIPCVPGLLPQCEYGLEILVTLASLQFLLNVSMDKLCGLMWWYHGLLIRKSQVLCLLNRLPRELLVISKHVQFALPRLRRSLSFSPTFRKQRPPPPRDFLITPLSDDVRPSPQDHVKMVAHNRIGHDINGKDARQRFEPILDELFPMVVTGPRQRIDPQRNALRTHRLKTCRTATSSSSTISHRLGLAITESRISSDTNDSHTSKT